jgi:glyoxylase I family protein
MENTVIGCTGFHHVALHSSDFEKSYKFYTEGLGFKEYRRWKAANGRTIALLDAGNGAMVELFSDGAERKCFKEQSGFYTHLALCVKDSKAAYERALKYGAQSKMEPTAMELPSEPPIPATISFVKGPDGEEIEFFEVR